MESGTKGVKGPRGPMGRVGIIPVEKGNKLDFIKFAKNRFNDFLVEDILKGGKEAEMYLLTDIRHCFEDIHRAALQYLGIGEHGKEQEKETEVQNEET